MLMDETRINIPHIIFSCIEVIKTIIFQNWGKYRYLNGSVYFTSTNYTNYKKVQTDGEK